MQERESIRLNNYSQFGIQSARLYKEFKKLGVTASFEFYKNTYPEFTHCVYNQLIKDGFKVVGMETRKTPNYMKKMFEKDSFFQKARYVLERTPYATRMEKFKKLTEKDDEKVVHILVHPTYGTIEISIIKVDKVQVSAGSRLAVISILSIDTDKSSAIFPYFENLFSTSKNLTDCLNKEFFPPVKRLTGIFTVSDFDTYAEVFEDINFRSTCPICLTTQPKDQNSCRYTYHNCNPTDLKHPEQKKLFEIFNDKGEITWCSSCNRICRNHGHFNNLKIDDVLSGAAVPKLQPGEFNVFSNDCSPYGGGFLEKFIRYENLLRESVNIQKLGAGITLADAKIRLVKAFWNGPLVIKDASTIDFLKTKRFTVSRDLFSIPGTEVAPIAPAVELTRNAEDMTLLPEKVEAPNNSCLIELGPHDDNRPVWKFKHRKADGTVFEHSDSELVCADDFMEGLTQSMYEMSGKCFINPSVCDATVHPFEVKQIIGTDDPRYVIYEKFYKERVMQGGGDTEGVFPKGAPFESVCPLPPKKTAGKKKTKKINIKKRRTTYRKKNNK